VFTGLVEEVGTVRSLRHEGESVVLSLRADLVRQGLVLGDSVSVDGACLTVTALDVEGFEVGLAPETVRRTALGEVRDEARVNLERAVRVGDRLGGHYVQGHVDGTATIVEFRPEGDSIIATFDVPESLAPYIVEKGFVAVDGVSLTVTQRVGSRVSVALIAYTRDHVALADKAVGHKVNIEADIVAKYVESLLAARLQPQTVV
jgi:riboflavin synthase